MFNRRMILLLLLSATTVWLSACKTQEPAPEFYSVEVYPRAKLVIASDELLGTVRLQNPIFRRVGQLTQSQVELMNYSDLTLDLEYRIDWTDSDGFKAGATGSWQFVSIPGHGFENLTSTGKVPEATKITVTVRLMDELFEDLPEDPEAQQY